MEELAGSHEPEEADDGELKDVVVEQAMVLVFKVKPVMHGFDEGEPDRVDTGLGPVVAPEAFDEVTVDR